MLKDAASSVLLLPSSLWGAGGRTPRRKNAFKRSSSVMIAASGGSGATAGIDLKASVEEISPGHLIGRG
jgi:hypothetical protein